MSADRPQSRTASWGRKQALTVTGDHVRPQDVGRDVPARDIRSRIVLEEIEVLSASGDQGFGREEGGGVEDGPVHDLSSVLARTFRRVSERTIECVKQDPSGTRSLTWMKSMFSCNVLSLPATLPKTPAASESTGKNAVIPVALLKTTCCSKTLIRDLEMVSPAGEVERSGERRAVRKGDG